MSKNNGILCKNVLLRRRLTIRKYVPGYIRCSMNELVRVFLKDIVNPLGLRRVNSNFEM